MGGEVGNVKIIYSHKTELLPLTDYPINWHEICNITWMRVVIF